MGKRDCKLKKTKIVFGSFGRRALLVIAGLVLGLNLYQWNAAGLAGNALPMPFGTGAAVVLSGSMEPALAVDDLIFVRAQKQYAVGDIVVYQSGTELIVHRIIAQDEKQITTQGDANNAADAPVDIRAVKGAVVLRIPRLGALVKLLKLPAVALLLLISACILVERSFRTEKRQQAEQLDEIKAEIRRLKAELEQTDTEKKDAEKKDAERR